MTHDDVDKERIASEAADSLEVGDRKAELSRLVRTWRERLRPEEIPGLVQAGNGRRSNRRRVSQDDMARLIEASTVWYGKLERGELAGYSDDFLDRTAYALRLSDDERMMLYLLAVGREPATQGTHSTVVVTDSLQRIVDRQPWPAYISDEAWDVVTFNKHMKNWFPWVGYESNVMRWVFTYPEARRQLYDWETDWAPLMLAQMLVANAVAKDNMRLGNLIREILQVNAFARDLWENQPKVYVHPDGDHRKLHLPFHKGVKEIEIVALAPLRATNVRLIMLVPTEE